MVCTVPTARGHCFPSFDSLSFSSFRTHFVPFLHVSGQRARRLSDAHDDWSQGPRKLLALASESVTKSDMQGNKSKAFEIMESVPEEDAPEISLSLDARKALTKEGENKQFVILDTYIREEKEMDTEEAGDSEMPENNRMLSAGILRTSKMGKHINIWTENTKNPDDNLAVLYAANMGFQAKTTGHRGSDFIYHFTRNVKKSIKKGEMQRLGDICDDIQRQLLKERSQMPEFKFNNTRNIVFGKNDKNTTNVEDTMGSSRG